MSVAHFEAGIIKHRLVIAGAQQAPGFSKGEVGHSLAQTEDYLSGGQLLTALGAAALDNHLTALGGHTGTKSMGSGAL